MSKHTPGPWRVVLDGQFIMDGETYIAEVITRKHSEEETNANANLLAAAPELYDSLSEMVTAFQGSPRTELTKARHILSKAVMQ